MIIRKFKGFLFNKLDELKLDEFLSQDDLKNNFLNNLFKVILTDYNKKKY